MDKNSGKSIASFVEMDLAAELHKGTISQPVDHYQIQGCICCFQRNPEIDCRGCRVFMKGGVQSN